MDKKIDRSQITFGKTNELENDDKAYWAKADIKEKLQTITYLRECFYGPEATTGRLQRVHNVIEVEGIQIFVISKADLIENKRASGRLRYLADAESLEDI